MSLGSSHPDLIGIYCENVRANHAECTGWSDMAGEYIDWPNPEYTAPKTRSSARGVVKEMSARTEAAPRVEGFSAGLQGSEKAAKRWDDSQVALVDKAIHTVAERHRGGGEFTSDAIWAELNGGVPVTKGLTARLMKASRAGLIDSTGKTETSQRGGHHDHGQRLTIWYSLL